MKMTHTRQALVGLLLGGGLLAIALGLTACPSSSPCEQACNNYASKCGGSSSSSSNGESCVQSCEVSRGSGSSSSSAGYTDILNCIANAKSCVEIENVCTSH
jgi:hypothetical protein